MAEIAKIFSARHGNEKNVFFFSDFGQKLLCNFYARILFINISAATVTAIANGNGNRTAFAIATVSGLLTNLGLAVNIL